MSFLIFSFVFPSKKPSDKRARLSLGFLDSDEWFHTIPHFFSFFTSIVNPRQKRDLAEIAIFHYA